MAEPLGGGVDLGDPPLGQGSRHQPRREGPFVALRLDATGRLLPPGDAIEDLKSINHDILKIMILYTQRIVNSMYTHNV